MKNFNFLTHKLKPEKNFSLEFAIVQNIGSLEPCHVLLKQQEVNTQYILIDFADISREMLL